MLTGFIEPNVPLAVFWIFVALAILIQGISKSGFAGGAGILSLPLMMMVMPVNKVAATMLPLLILCDMNAIYHHWDNKVWKPILELYIPSLLGILLGAVVWWWVGREGVDHYGLWIKRAVGVIAIVFALYIVAAEVSLQWVARHAPGRAVGAAAGVAAGFTSTIAHAAGPIVGLYIFAQGLGKTLFVGTIAWTFTLINLSKVPFYMAVGLLDFSVLRFDVLLIPLIPIGSCLGKWMYTRISESLFNRIVMVLTLITGIDLLFNIRSVQMILECLMKYV